MALLICQQCNKSLTISKGIEERTFCSFGGEISKKEGGDKIFRSGGERTKMGEPKFFGKLLEGNQPKWDTEYFE